VYKLDNITKMDKAYSKYIMVFEEDYEKFNNSIKELNEKSSRPLIFGQV
jgi:hypothetical protein